MNRTVLQNYVLVMKLGHFLPGVHKIKSNWIFPLSADLIFKEMKYVKKSKYNVVTKITNMENITLIIFGNKTWMNLYIDIIVHGNLILRIY